MESVSDLAHLLEETGQAHHAAFAETDGEDPDWPQWYASYLADRLPGVLGKRLQEDEIAALLVAADQAHRAAQAEVSWPIFYARRLAEAED